MTELEKLYKEYLEARRQNAEHRALAILEKIKELRKGIRTEGNYLKRGTLWS